METLLQYLNFAIVSNHLTLIGIYTILALSLNLINGSLGVFSLGHNAFWGMGAYAAAAVVWMYGTPAGGACPFFASFIVAILAAAVFGLLVGLPCLRLRGDYLAIATLGFAEIFVICVRNSETWSGLASLGVFQSLGFSKIGAEGFASRGLGGAAGFSLDDGFQGGNDFALSLTGSNTGREWFYLILTWVLVAVTFVVIRNLLRSAHGRAIVSICEDETAAELLGVNLTRYKVLAFVLGAAFAGLAGALYANFRSSVSPNNFLMMEGIKVLLMVVLGGLGSQSGTLMAVALLYVSEQALGVIKIEVPFLKYHGDKFVVEPQTLKDLWQVIFSVLLILLMLLKPDGIMGRNEFSRAYFRGLWAGWRRDVLSLALTFIQWIQFLLVLLLATDPWLLLGSIILLLGLQVFKKIRREQKERLYPAGGAS
ncbi:MAG: branched-chain amino acid ABC transporter permease [Planctomycetes bacterium]|nr:branched-chain amino acid ABC transporter permease [Planctomycetota bacterium]